MCCNIHAGSVVWICPFSSHASELTKSCLQESVGVRQLRAVPRCSQPAVKRLLTDVQKERNNGAVLGTSGISSRMGFENVMAIQSWRRHNQHKTFGREARRTGRRHWQAGSPVLLQLARAALQTNANLSELASKTPGSPLILINQLLANSRLLS